MPTLGTFGAAAARGFGLTSGPGLIPIAVTISSNTANYTLNTAKAPGYVAGKSAVTLTINSGVIVSSSSTGSYAFSVDNSWSVGDRVTIVNNGTILGRGGNGGGGNPGSTGFPNPGLPGSAGGPALFVNFPTTINNGSGRIAGGGGGGGGGGASSSPAIAGGSGGGGGIGGSNGGPGGASSSSFPGIPGTAGTLTANGTGGPAVTSSGKFTFSGGKGGDGGSYGSSGNNGNGAGGGDGGSGGAAGGAIVGVSKVTFAATGTINGSQTG